MTEKTESLICCAGFGGLDPKAPDFAAQVEDRWECLLGAGLEGTAFDVDYDDPLVKALLQLPKAECGAIFVALDRLNTATHRDLVSVVELEDWRAQLLLAPVETDPLLRGLSEARLEDAKALGVLLGALKGVRP